MFQGGIIWQNNQQVHNEQYQLLLLGQKIEEKGPIVRPYNDVRNIFPRWIVEKSEDVPSTTNIVKFTQAYYDWLYNFSEYELVAAPYYSSGMIHLIDIETTSVKFLKQFTYMYASGFPEHFIGKTAGPDGTDTTENIRTFIKNIRQGFYQRKSTEDAYRYFFKTLFDTTDKIGNPQETEFFYPKADMLRLNGGKFDGWLVTIDGGETGHYGGVMEDIYSGNRGDIGPPVYHLGGSYLNGRYVIQDSYWYQDYSYLLKGYVSDIDEETGLPLYFDILHEMLHPAGMKGFWEKTEVDYIPPDDFGGGFNFCESPKLMNYFAYRMKDTKTIEFCAGCSGSGHTYDGPTAMFNGINEANMGGTVGWTYGSAWNSIGDGGICIEGTKGSTGDVWGGITLSGEGNGITFGAPTHHYPHWSLGISGSENHSTPFEDIYIGEFIQLCPLEDSPNLGLTGCTGYTKC
jgi:hypothetical protein